MLPTVHSFVQYGDSSVEVLKEKERLKKITPEVNTITGYSKVRAIA
jgi:hypothetical protein